MKQMDEHFKELEAERKKKSEQAKKDRKVAKAENDGDDAIRGLLG